VLGAAGAGTAASWDCLQGWLGPGIDTDLGDV